MIARLPQRFVDTITCAFGDPGRKWLSELPELLLDISSEWQISVSEHYSNLSYHYVAPCICADGSEAVLKIGFPGDPNPTIFNEVEMLRLNGGAGMVKLLRFDPGRRAMLLEKLTPGEDLRTIFEAHETNVIPIAVDLMRRIWRDAPEKSSFPILEDWFNNGFGKALKTNFPAEHVNKAWNIFNEVNSQTGRRLLLHGDLHHWNILSAVREPYLVIDPKGIIGNFGYELSTFLINHANWLRDKEDRKEKLDAAIHEFSLAFDLNPQTVRKWTYAQSVLSAWWTFEEGSEKWRDELARTEIWDV